MLRLELQYEFEAIGRSQVRQVRVPKIWDAFPTQTEPFCPELLLESLEVADAHCPGAVFPWCVWNIVENWRHCGALVAQLLSDNRTDVLFNPRPSTWHKSGWDSYDVSWEACPVRCTGVLAQLSLPGLWRSAKRWPVVAALARLEAWWHGNKLSMPLVGAWYAAQLFGGPAKAAVEAAPHDVPQDLQDLMYKARIAGSAFREELLSSRSMEESLDEPVLRELAPWPSGLRGRGSVCGPVAVARHFAREDTARLGIAASARSAKAAQAELASVAAHAVDSAASCLVGALVTVRANASTTIHGDKSIKQMVKSVGQPSASELVFIVRPGRDVVADKVRHDRMPGCWQQGIFRAVTRVAALRRITPAQPLRLIEIGAASGDCHMQVMANLGPLRMKALVLEPFPPALERLRRNLALNGLEGSVEVRAQGLGSRSERVPLCGDSGNDVSLFFSKCGSGQTQFAEVEVVTLASLLDSSGAEFWDVLSIAPQILEGCPDAFHGLVDLRWRVRFISLGSCLVSVEDFMERGAELDTEVDC